MRRVPRSDTERARGRLRRHWLRFTVIALTALVSGGRGWAEVPPRFTGIPNDLNDHWELISYLPPGADRVRAEERELGSGIWADRAWRHTKGRWEVRIAVLDSGIEWDERDLIYKVYLNPEELQGEAAPRVDRATPVSGAVIFPGMETDCTRWSGTGLDANGDGIFNLEDYLCDARIDPTVGIDAADEIVDPSDLIALFSDGVDDDRNGYVDDIAGWDAFENDNDPYDDTRYGHGTGEAEDSAAEGDNGTGGIGVCPGCSFVPVRVGDSFITDANRFADGVHYAIAISATVVQEALGTLNMTPTARAAIEAAWRAGILVVGSAADEASRHVNWPGGADLVLYVHAVVYDGPTPDASTTFLNFSNCTNYGIRLDLSTPARGCSSGATGRTSGAAGLVASAALDAGLDPPLHPAELKGLLLGTADDLAFPDTPTNGTRHPTYPGWDPVSGWGRLNVDRAVEAVFAGRIPPRVTIHEPRWLTVIDPTRTTGLTVRAELAAPRSSGLSWRLEAAGGGDVRRDDWRTLAAGEATTTGTELQLTLPWTKLPVSPVRGLADQGIYGWALSLRLVATDDRGVAAIDRKVLFVRADPELVSGFPLRLGGSLEASPKPYDVDDDGADELVVVSGDGRLHLLEGDASERPGFPVLLAPRRYGPQEATGTTGRGLIGTPAIGDVDGDGAVEIVVADLEGVLAAYELDGTLVPGFPVVIPAPPPSRPDQRVDDGWFASPVLADLDGDGAAEIVLPGLDGLLHVYRGDGGIQPGFPVPISDPNGGYRERIVATAAVGDIDGNGSPEIVVGSNEFFTAAAGVPATVRLHAVRAEGNRHPAGPYPPGWPVRLAALAPDVLPYIGRGYPGSVVLAEWDPGRPGLEILVAPLTGMPEVLDGRGETVLRMRIGPYGAGARTLDTPMLVPIVHPSAADLDEDGTPDPIVPMTGFRYFLAAANLGQRIDHDHLVAAWSGHNGELFPGMPTPIEDWTFFGNPVVGDVDGDGNLEILQGSGEYRLHAWRIDGSEPRGWPKHAHGWLLASPALADLEGDGRLEVVATTREGYLWAWRTGAPARYVDGRLALAWPSYHRTPANNANLELPLPRHYRTPERATPTGCGLMSGEAVSWAPLLAALFLLVLVRRHRRLPTWPGQGRISEWPRSARRYTDPSPAHHRTHVPQGGQR